MADPQEGTLLVDAVPAEGAIRAEAVASVAMIDLGTGGSKKDRKVQQERCGNLRRLSVSPRRTVLPSGVSSWSASGTSAQLVASRAEKQ